MAVRNHDDDLEELQVDLIPEHRPCGISFRDLSYSIPCMKKIDSNVADVGAINANPTLPGRRSNNQLMQQMVLSGIHGKVRPGEIMAIMGGSGAGKTTCLDILARRNKSGTTGGDILVNDKFMDYSEYREITGYLILLI